MAVKNAALSADAPTRTEVFYPETDGMPLPDGYYQSEHLYDLITMLKMFFALREDVVVGGDIFIYYVEGDASLTVAPDCFVVIGVSVESFEMNNTYLMWDVGKSPDFVLEIGSPSTAMNDLGRKRDLYASLGIGEYWMFDPSGGEHYGFPLRGERLADGEYRRLDMREDADGGVWGHSPTLNLELHWVEESLRLYDPLGERWFQTPSELEAERTIAESRAESERAARETAEAAVEVERTARETAEAAVEVERTARETAESRLAELEAELRRLRGQG